jgi:hypothetical protein
MILTFNILSARYHIIYIFFSSFPPANLNIKGFFSRIIVNTKEVGKKRPRTYKLTYSSECGKKRKDKKNVSTRVLKKEQDKNNNGDKNQIKNVPGCK